MRTEGVRPAERQVLATHRRMQGSDMADVSNHTERVDLSEQDVAYLVGKMGATRMRLERFSGAVLKIDRDIAEVEGTPQQRMLAKLAISITLQQRDHGAVAVDFDELERRPDVSTFDVPRETVGFLLGAKGSTLRAMETNHKVFMFFNNDRIREGKSVCCAGPSNPARAPLGWDSVAHTSRDGLQATCRVLPFPLPQYGPCAVAT